MKTVIHKVGSVSVITDDRSIFQLVSVFGFY